MERDRLFRDNDQGVTPRDPGCVDAEIRSGVEAHPDTREGIAPDHVVARLQPRAFVVRGQPALHRAER